MILHKVFLYQNTFGKHSWFLHLDRLKLELFPWFFRWIQDFSPEISFLPYLIDKKYEIFKEKINKALIIPLVNLSIIT